MPQARRPAKPVTARSTESLRLAIASRTRAAGEGCLLWEGGVDSDG